MSLLRPNELYRREKHTLTNGLRVVTVELPHLHSASIVMYAKVGSRYEDVRDNGLSHFLEHMLFRGTERLPDAFQINHAIEALGGTLYAETGRDYSLYQISLHPESVRAGVALFGEIFSSPQFSDLDVERRIILEEVAEDLDEDGRLVNIDDIARAAVFPDHPLGYRITGPSENVERFELADVRRHFGRCYGAENMVVCVSGAVRHDEVFPLLEAALSGLPSGSELELSTPTDGQRAPQFLYVRHRGPQTHAQLIFRGLPESDPDYPSLLALGRIVDDGMSTRLHRRLCDELGLAYYVSGSLEHFFDTGLFEIDGNAAHDNIPKMVSESLALLSRLRADPPGLDELHKAQRRYRWDLESTFDDPDAMAGWWGGSELFTPPVGFEEKVARMQAVTPEAISRVAGRIFRPERLTVACVGTLRPALESKVRDAVLSYQ
jgi:predicted Zn-dependent peptidase